MRCNVKPIMITFCNEKKEMEAKASQNVSWKTNSLENRHQNRALELRYMMKPII
jgi:hypothetical protein